MYAFPHLPQRSSPERTKSDALPRRFACSPRSRMIACALAKVNSSTSGSCTPSKTLSRQRIFPA
jgi:hypothetical protein